MKHRPSEHRRRVVDNRKEAVRIASAWSSKGFITTVSDDQQRVVSRYEAKE
jgi:hypothetical protein